MQTLRAFIFKRQEFDFSVAIKNPAGERIEYTLDAAGNRTQQIIKNNAGTIVYSVAQAFDELSRVMAVTGNHGQNNKQQYDANDNQTSTVSAAPTTPLTLAA